MTGYCFKPNQSTEPQPNETRCVVGRIVFSFVLLIFLVSVTGLYLWQTNSFVSQGYCLNQSKKDLQILEDEQRDLLLALADLQSLKNLKQRSQDLSLVEIDQMSYLSLPSPMPAVALLTPVSY